MLDACMLIDVYWTLYNSTMVQQNKSRWHKQLSWMDHRAKAFEGSHISLSSTAPPPPPSSHAADPRAAICHRQVGCSMSGAQKLELSHAWLVVRQLGRTKLDGLGWMDHRRLKGRTYCCRPPQPLLHCCRQPNLTTILQWVRLKNSHA